MWKFYPHLILETVVSAPKLTQICYKSLNFFSWKLISKTFFKNLFKMICRSPIIIDPTRTWMSIINPPANPKHSLVPLASDNFAAQFNFQGLFLLVHLMIPFQHSVMSVFGLFENFGKICKYLKFVSICKFAYWPTFENFVFSSLSWTGKNWEVQLRATFKYPSFQFLCT